MIQYKLGNKGLEIFDNHFQRMVNKPVRYIEQSGTVALQSQI